MDKSILISIQPQNVENILNGKKPLEIRKTVPSGFKGWVYIYCTKSKILLQEDVLRVYSKESRYITDDKYLGGSREILNGSVVARFWFDEYKTLEYHKKNEVLMWDNNYYYYTEEDNTYCSVQWILDELCLEHHQVLEYGKEKDLYAWHIKKLEVFDEPMSLSDFYKDNHYPKGEIMSPQICTPSVFDHDNDYQNCLKTFEVTRAPQSWQYVWRIEQ